MIGAHPEIFVSSIKEPDFFASDIRHAAHPAGAVDDWSRYLALFEGASDGQRLGEGSVSYLTSRVAARGIRDRCPDARILMVLRDPADRLFAHYKAAVASDSTRARFPEWLEAALTREKADSAPIGPVAAGRYGVNLKRYRDVFPADRIHIVWHEDYVSDPASVVREIFTFLGVDETRQVPVNIRRNETHAVRSSLLKGAATVLNVLSEGMADRINLLARMPSTLQPTPRDRALAIQVYENDIRTLAEMTGRDLSHWIRATGEDPVSP